MVEARADAASPRSPSPMLVMLLPLGLLVVIGLAAWAMFANPVPGAVRAGSTPSGAATPMAAPLPEPSYTDNGSMNAAALIAEYREAAAGLAEQLPEGYHFPNEPATGVDPEVIVPPGSGEYEALVFWRCAWTAQFLTDFDDKNREAMGRDLDVLDSWLDHSIVTRDDEDGSQAAIWRDEIMQPARDGHVGNLRAFGLGPCKPVPTPDPAIQLAPAS